MLGLAYSIATAGRTLAPRRFLSSCRRAGASPSRQLVLRAGQVSAVTSVQRKSPANGRPTLVTRHSTLAPSAARNTPTATTPAPSEYEDVAAVATGGYAYAGVPSFSDLAEKQGWQLEHMAGAFRVFARMGFTEGASGHISVRDPIDPDTFWINP